MTAKPQVDINEMARGYAELVRERELPIRSVWTSHSRSGASLWLVTQPAALEELRPVYEARIALRKAFPDSEFEIVTLNPAWIPGFAEEEQIPEGSQRIELHP